MEYQQPIQSQLFQADTGFGNVVLNFRNRADDEFDMYARAFHRSARSLSAQMLTSSGHNDLDVCPIIFLYRHALELYLKAIARIGKTIVELAEDEPSITERYLIGHELSKFLPIVKLVFKQVEWDWNYNVEGLKSFEELEQLLKDFDDVDKKSYAFRYPLDTNKQASVPHHFIINIPNFCHQIDELLSLLDGATTGLREIRYSCLEQMYRNQNPE